MFSRHELKRRSTHRVAIRSREITESGDQQSATDR
jgi:hypothetical protein